MRKQPHFPDKNSSGDGEDFGDRRAKPQLSAALRVFLASLGLSPEAIDRANTAARKNGSALEEELMAAGHISERAIYAGLAACLGLPFIEHISVDEILDRAENDALLRFPQAIRLRPLDRSPKMAIAPPLARLDMLLKWVRESAAVRRHVVIARPAAIRDAVWKSGATRRLAQVKSDLFEHTPDFSARYTLTAVQGCLLGFAMAASVAIALAFPGPVLDGLHLVLALGFFGTVCIRLLSVPFAWRAAEPETLGTMPTPVPIYTIMVALYREAPVVPQLLQALQRVDWPPARLDIKLVCEEDDPETLDALARADLPTHLEVVRVPPGQPRTKPKALTYALAGARGEFVTIYDAEDRPHPQQLREALARFLKSDRMLGCLQSPLIVTNAGETWLSTLFALEYAALFRCFLPMLSARHLPLPLGGTSNHFRRSVLMEVGGWDPYNVTEDADLGLRLSRLGYRSETLCFPTLEEGPSTFGIWYAQRSRWFKGWLQTLLVSTRKPLTLWLQLTFPGLVAFLLTSGGMVISLMIHPFLAILVLRTITMAIQGNLPPLYSGAGVLIMIDTFNLVAGYGYFLYAGRRVMQLSERHFPRRHLLMAPVYWLLLSLAAWRALRDLYANPHAWNKTPHQPTKSTRFRTGPA